MLTVLNLFPANNTECRKDAIIQLDIDIFVVKIKESIIHDLSIPCASRR